MVTPPVAKWSPCPLEQLPEQVNPQQCKWTLGKRKLFNYLGLSLAFAVIFFIPSIIVWLKICPGPSCDCKLATLAQSRPLCPRFWIAYEGTCYFFSKEERNWTSSQVFCSSFNASLARTAEEDKDFVMWLKGKDSYWIDLKMDQDKSWKWTNGENSTLDIIGNGGSCAYLTDDFKASISRCSTEHRWICQKPLGVDGPVVAQKEDGAYFSGQGS